METGGVSAETLLLRYLADLARRAQPAQPVSDVFARLDVVSRLQAIIDEIDAGEAEDVARTLAEALLEDVAALVANQRAGE
jgi:hypothetical protein